LKHKKVNLLSKSEMKKVLGGGVPAGGDGCLPSECSKNNLQTTFTYYGNRLN